MGIWMAGLSRRPRSMTASPPASPRRLGRQPDENPPANSRRLPGRFRRGRARRAAFLQMGHDARLRRPRETAVRNPSADSALARHDHGSKRRASRGQRRSQQPGGESAKVINRRTCSRVGESDRRALRENLAAVGEKRRVRLDPAADVENDLKKLRTWHIMDARRRARRRSLARQGKPARLPARRVGVATCLET